MPHLGGTVGKLSFDVQVTRKDTGIIETHRLEGYVTQDDLDALDEAGVTLQPGENSDG